MARASERVLKASMESLRKELDEAREQLSSMETTMEGRTTNDKEAVALERAVSNSRRATLAAEAWVAKAQAATIALKARESEMAAQASALAQAKESQDAAEQATIAAQLSLKEAVDALAARDSQLAMLSRDLELERHTRAVYDSAAAAATPAEESTTERLDEQRDDDSEDERGGDEGDADAGSDPEADDCQLEACRLVGSVLAEQLAAVEDDALRLHHLEHGLVESGDVGLDSVGTSSPLRALAGLGAKSRGLGSNQLARLSDRLDKAVGAASTSTMTSPTLGCVLAAPGGNFTSALGAGGVFMGPGSSTHSAPAIREPDFRPAPQLWEFKKKLPRIVSGGPPCVWAAEAGK